MDPIYHIAISPNYKNDRMLFVAKASGLYRSKDLGKHLESVYRSLQLDTPLSTTSVVFAPDYIQSGHVFAAVSGGILRSDDRGNTWTVSVLPTPPPFITTLQISPKYSEDGILVAGTMDDGIFRSSNHGGTWSSWNFGLFDLHILCLAFSPDFVNDKAIFVGTESGIFKSLNGGLGWQEVSFPVDCAPVISMALSHSYLEDRTIIAGTETSGVFISTDNGASWENFSPSEVIGSVNGIILPKPQNLSRMIVMTDNDIRISNDLALSWRSLGNGIGLDSQPTAFATIPGLGNTIELMVGFSDGKILHSRI